MGDAHSVRVSRLSDAHALDALLRASYSRLLAGHYDRDLLAMALPYMTRANATLLASGTYYVAECSGGKLVGCGGWSLSRPGSTEKIEGEGHVRHFATAPGYVGQGIGRSLIERCLEDASPRVHTLNCYASRNAEPFYRACGFRTIAPMEVPMGPTVKFPVVLMTCRLAERGGRSPEV